MSRADGIHIKRVQRQHSSVVVGLPAALRFALGIKAGDYVVFSQHQGTGVVEMTKFCKEVHAHGRDTAGADRKVEIRGTRAQVGAPK